MDNNDILLFDFDGTIADSNSYAVGVTGNPIGVDDPKSAFNRLKNAIAQGRDARIFTARVFPLGISEYHATESEITDALKEKAAVQEWCQTHLNKVIPVQCWKNKLVIVINDDKAAQVIPNTGILLEDLFEEHLNLCPDSTVN